MCSSNHNSCLNCGKAFALKIGRTNKYCNQSCYWEYMRSSGAYKRGSSRKATCHHCGSDVTGRSPSVCRNGKKSEKMFCGRACYDKHRAEVVESRVSDCKHCGASFLGAHSGKSIFCSMACKTAHNKPKPINCVNCGCYFTAMKATKRRGGKVAMVAVSSAKTCSSECHNQWIRNNQARKDKISAAFTGTRHPNWQGGPQYKHRGARGYGWQKARRAALKRDKYTCQRCGITNDEHVEKTGKGLEVNHITPFWQYRGDNQKANRLSNLESLCKSCHQKAEWEYRKSNPMQIGLKMFD